VEAHRAFSQQTSSKLGYRLAIPAGVLCLNAIMAGLWLSGAYSLYFGALRLLGIDPFSFPFLDTHAVLAAAECARQGIQVYLSNPCDVLGRPHVYSPLWLAIVPGSLGTGATGGGREPRPAVPSIIGRRAASTFRQGAAYPWRGGGFTNDRLRCGTRQQ
jgi:hypothetical protein